MGMAIVDGNVRAILVSLHDLCHEGKSVFGLALEAVRVASWTVLSQSIHLLHMYLHKVSKNVLVH